MNKCKQVIKILSYFVMLSVLSCSTQQLDQTKGSEKKDDDFCETAKEYITTYNYLNSNKDDLGISDVEIKNVSMDVAKGCNGSASRFIQTLNIINKVGLGTRTALKTGIFLSQKSDAYTQSFVDLFLVSYLEDKLNLDIRTSFKIAEDLSLNFVGQPEYAVKDFKKLTQFCIENKNLNLSLPLCADLIASTIKAVENYNQLISEDFIDVFSFLKSSPHLQLNSSDALKLTKEIVVSSPGAVKNFKQAFEFSISQNGHNNSSENALGFARQIVRSSAESYKKRMPASK